MSPTRKQRSADIEERLREAEGASESLQEQGKKVDRQLNLVERLSIGWRRVHERNHLAQLFHEQGGL